MSGGLINVHCGPKYLKGIDMPCDGSCCGRPPCRHDKPTLSARCIWGKPEAAVMLCPACGTDQSGIVLSGGAIYSRATKRVIVPADDKSASDRRVEEYGIIVTGPEA